MLAELTRIDSVWPLALSLAGAVTARGLVVGRRRNALNEALHELRRPLQALVLAVPPTQTAAGTGSDLPLQAALALKRLDREINGGPEVAVRSPVVVAELLEASLRRWRQRANLAGASLDLKAGLGGVIASVDQAGFSQALDNLIINAIEHGGARIVVGAELDSGVLRVGVSDSGRSGRPDPRWRPWQRGLAGLSGRGRHGHGLRVVRRVAAAHGGEFRLRQVGPGVEATLELRIDAVGEG
jgi:signal transduction histidine kinase